MLLKSNKPKIFCIGENKTGTTSLKKFFIDHGYKIGDQETAERLTDSYIARNWKPILKYCQTAQVFQDVPFSNEYLYVLLDYHFPNSKFILSVRSSPDEWYQSVTTFHTKLFGKNGKLPTKLDLQNANYRVKGFIWKIHQEKYGCNEDELYNKDFLIKSYLDRNERIKKYFENKNNFLTVNVSDKDAVTKLSSFLNIKANYTEFPWENKTSRINFK